MSGKNGILIGVGVVIVAIIGLKMLTSSPTIEWGGNDPFIHVYDSHTNHAEAKTSASFAVLKGWKDVTESELSYSFGGDTVVHNDKLVLVFRQGGNGIDLYSMSELGPVLQSTLVPFGTEEAQSLQSVTFIENSTSRAELEAVYSTSGGEQLGVNVELMIGQAYVKTAATADTKKIAIQSPTPHVVMPDFFADDIVIHAEEIKVNKAALPSENFLMHMVDDGNAIVMSVWENREQEVQVKLGDSDGKRAILQSEIAYGDDGNVWVAVLAEPNIWHSYHVSRLDGGKVIPLEWSQPFTAVWRVDWQRDDDLTDSWEMLAENPDGSFRKTNIFETSGDEWSDHDWWGGSSPRTRITPGMGKYMYPCWVDINGAGFLQPLNNELKFRGPAILYPINREADTPLEKFTVTDLIRATLGQGPCEYILDVEGQGQEFRGKPTCDVRDTLDDIYGANQQIAKSNEVSQALDDVTAFIRLIRGRIGEYEKFAYDMGIFLKEEKSKSGAPKKFIADMERQLLHLNSAVAKRRPGMKTPEYAQDLVNQFRMNVANYDGADANARCRTLTRGFVQIGENQDELVAECRQAVKIMRQHAAMAMANDPTTIELAKAVRERCKDVLSSPVNYEAPRH